MTLKKDLTFSEMDRIQDGSMYWFINSAGAIDENVWRMDTADQFRYRTGNWFPTLERAEKALHWLGVYCLVVEKIKDLNNGWVPDFENERHYFFTYNALEQKVHLDWGFNSHTLGIPLLMKSNEIGEKVMKELTEEVIEYWLTFKR